MKPLRFQNFQISQTLSELWTSQISTLSRFSISRSSQDLSLFAAISVRIIVFSGYCHLVHTFCISQFFPPNFIFLSVTKSFWCKFKKNTVVCMYDSDEPPKVYKLLETVLHAFFWFELESLTSLRIPCCRCRVFGHWESIFSRKNQKFPRKIAF